MQTPEEIHPLFLLLPLGNISNWPRSVFSLCSLPSNCKIHRNPYFKQGKSVFWKHCYRGVFSLTKAMSMLDYLTASAKVCIRSWATVEIWFAPEFFDSVVASWRDIALLHALQTESNRLNYDLMPICHVAILRIYWGNTYVTMKCYHLKRQYPWGITQH